MNTLGKYVLHEQLGKGGYGTVFRATDPIGRVVAIKILKPGFADDPDVTDRFRREALAAGSLFHPHIATILDFDELDGRLYLVMRYINGTPLDQLIEKRKIIPWEEALLIFEQVGRALEFAHKKGLTHRDIKPGNIIVSPSEGAVITDFGLVKAIQTSGITTTGVTLGTPQYISPEIWLGKLATPAVDQYALACVLIEMLTGESPFYAATPPAVMARHFQPLTLPENWPVSIPTYIPDVLLKALSQDPLDRFDSILDFTNAIIGDKQSIDKKVEEGSSPAIPPLPIQNDIERDVTFFSTPQKIISKFTEKATICIRSIEPHSYWEYVMHTPGEVEIPPGFEVGIKGDGLTDKSLNLLLEDIKNFPIVYLDISENKKLTERSLKNLQLLSTLRELNLSFCTQLSDYSLDDLRHLQNLTHLELKGLTNITSSGLSVLPCLKNLQFLSLEGCIGLVDDDLSNLVNLFHLENLDLGNCPKITDQGINNFQLLGNLEVLTIDGCKNLLGTCLSTLQKLPKLKKLDISNNSQIAEEHFVDFLNCHQLTWLNLGYLKQLTRIGFSFISKMHWLESLYVYNCDQLTDDHFALICGLTNMKHLNLSECIRLTDKGFSEIEKLSKLEFLDLGNTLISDVGLNSLGHLKNLKYLYLGGNNKITDNDLKSLSRLNKLEFIDFRGCSEITGTGFVHFSEIPNLNYILMDDADWIDRLNLTDELLINLGKISFIKQETHFSLSNQGQVTGCGLSILRTMPWLRSLTLRSIENMIDQDLDFLCNLTQLEWLDLSKNPQLTDACMVYFENLKNLSNLFLRDCSGMNGSGFVHLKNSQLFRDYFHIDIELNDEGINALTNLPQYANRIEGLDLSNNQKITDDGLRYLERFPCLKRLDLSNCKKITPNGLNHLVYLPNLQELSIDQIAQNDQYFQLLCQLPKVAANISELRINDSEEDQISNTAMPTFVRFPNLESLIISCNSRITNAGFSNLARLSKIKSLTLSNCHNLDDDTLFYIKDLSNLEELDLTMSKRISDHGIKQIMNLKKLRTLKLSHCEEITLIGITGLADLDQIQEITLEACYGIEDDSLIFFRFLTSLKVLNLNFTRISSKGLLNLSSNKNLEELRLAGCHLIDDEALDNLTLFTGMKVLDLAFIDSLSDLGIMKLSLLKHLEKLELTRCLITNKSLSAICQNSSITGLYLSQCKNINDESLKYLKNLPFLEDLNLSECNEITDQGLSILSEMINLKNLDISHNDKISDYGIQYLQRLHNLETLSINGSHISSTAVNEMKREGLTIYS